jgi:uroporphyrinogen-III decarboxylase
VTNRDRFINCMQHKEIDRMPHWECGMDVVQVQRTYGASLGIIGGIDKKQLVPGPAAIEAEVHCRLDGMGETGYIATLDHSPVPEIPYAHYLHYLRCVMPDTPCR